MTEHDKYREMIQAYLDGFISEEEEKELMEHLKVCRECRRKLEERENTLSIIRDSRIDAVPEKHLTSKIIRETSQKRSNIIVRRFIAVAAAAIIILSLILAYQFTADKTRKITEKDRQQEEFIVEEDSGYDTLLDDSTEYKEEEKEKDKEEGAIQIVKSDEFSGDYIVYPEEGSVVGKNFEVVLVLKESVNQIELFIDGEKETFKSGGSNIVYISNKELPPLEEGMHHLSMEKPETGRVNFYKEG